MSLPKPITGELFRAFTIPLTSVQNIFESNGFPTPTSVRRIKKGEVNAVFEVQTDHKTLILKVWVRKPDAQEMQFEEKVIRLVREKTNIPTPKWLHTHSGDENIQYPYVIMEHVNAQDADDIWHTLSQKDRQNFIENCAVSLRALHALSLSPADIPAETPLTGAAWAKTNDTQFYAAIQDLGKQGWMPKTVLQNCEQIYERKADVLKQANNFSLVHYDFHLRNLRIHPTTSQLKAVLDFGNATCAPAVTDVRDMHLNIFHNHPKLNQQFWTIYGAPNNTQNTRLQLHALTRLLDIMAIYHGPTPSGGNTDTVKSLLNNF